MKLRKLIVIALPFLIGCRRDIPSTGVISLDGTCTVQSDGVTFHGRYTPILVKAHGDSGASSITQKVGLHCENMSKADRKPEFSISLSLFFQRPPSKGVYKIDYDIDTMENVPENTIEGLFLTPSAHTIWDGELVLDSISDGGTLSGKLNFKARRTSWR